MPPRSGPRPFVFTKRAWHSASHQPLRGLLIQEIFRIVYEIHSTSTKSNTEWQEKLPVVVLRVEEILYSKASSEAEYMDLKTLLDRTNEAIKNIIRLDETTETGDFIQPCIEAALHLGCTQKTGPRSQQNLNPICYLTQHSTNILANQYQIFLKPNEDVVRTPPQEKRLEKCPVSSTYSTYPLCYSFGVPLPVSKNAMDSCKSKNSRSVSGLDETKGVAFGGCDLTLRLGPLGDNNSPTQKRCKISNNNNT